MIRKIQGTLESVEGQQVAVHIAGISYEALVPAYACEALVPRVGDEVTLHTLQLFESQGNNFVPRLIGFLHTRDRIFFERFTTVKGLGARRALRAMALPPIEIATAIARKDAKALQKLPEIGKRLADTIIAELQGKLDAFTIDEDFGVEAKPTSPLMQEAVGVLMTLGESQADAERKVERAMGDDVTDLDALLSRVYEGA